MNPTLFLARKRTPQTLSSTHLPDETHITLGIVLGVFTLVLLGAFGSGGGRVMLGVQAVLTMTVAIICGVLDWKRHRRLTLVMTFAGIYTFVYAARALAISLTDDFAIFYSVFLLSPTWTDLSNTMCATGLGLVMLMLGAMALDNKAAKISRESLATWKTKFSGVLRCGLIPRLTMLGIQIGSLFLIYRIADPNQKLSLTELSDSAYIYLGPTLVHGSNLFITILFLIRAIRFKAPEDFLMAGISITIDLVCAYLMVNLSTFRSFFLAGILLIGVSLIYSFRGRLNPLLLVFLFLIYPYFKYVGGDRSLTGSELVAKLVDDPLEAYSADSLTNAFGPGTDLNMFDTFLASLQWDHRWRPYVLSVAYVAVHWVPRSLWPGKPLQGNLADTGYTYGVPYSPGIIGFFNDDGGVAYMLVMMAVVGLFLRYLDIRVYQIKDGVLQSCVFACVFFGTLVLVRSFAFQAFWGVAAFMAPLLILYWVFGRNAAPAKHVARL
jgi:hypothetical protein